MRVIIWHTVSLYTTDCVNNKLLVRLRWEILSVGIVCFYSFSKVTYSC